MLSERKPDDAHLEREVPQQGDERRRAAKLIKNGDTIGFAGFTGSGYPKALPVALAAQIKAAHARGDEFRINVLTGASTAPELDGALAETGGVGMRMPYQSDPSMRNAINNGTSDYHDVHLSHSAARSPRLLGRDGLRRDQGHQDQGGRHRRAAPR